MTHFRTPILILLLTACGGKSGSSDSGTSDTGFSGTESPHTNPEDEIDTTPVDATAEPLFDVTGGPYDLAADGQGRVYCSIQESRLMVWDPLVGWAEEVSDSLGPIFGIELAGDAVYFTTSAHRQEGSLSRLIDGEVEVIATAAGSTIFREPTDLAMAPDGDWVLADKTLQTLIGVSDDGDAWLIGTPGPVSTLAFQGSTLYFGGEEGIWSMEWPDGDPVSIDPRSVNGLHAYDGAMWGTNTEYRIYEVGGERTILVEDVRVPGRMDGSDTLYLADWGLADVWAVEL